jgi:nicotinate-nucleotide adenylyltransferase
MKIGICGGTFDPFHRGHLDPILAVRERVQWDRVLYVPAFMQPFKQDRLTASPFHRFAMVSLSILDRDALFATPMELERGRVSYTVETLEELRAQHPHDTIDWVIGDDNVAQLLEWKSIERIFELANFIVLTRIGGAPPGGAPAASAGEERVMNSQMNSAPENGRRSTVPPSLAHRVSPLESRPTHGAIAFAENATVPISSTDVRRRVRDGEAIDHLVPPPVSRYIHHYGLYRKGQS